MVCNVNTILGRKLFVLFAGLFVGLNITVPNCCEHSVFYTLDLPYFEVRSLTHEEINQRGLTLTLARIGS